MQNKRREFNAPLRSGVRALQLHAIPPARIGARRLRLWVNAAIYAALAFTAFLWVYQIISTHPSTPINAFEAPNLVAALSSISVDKAKDDEADTIIRRSYERTYAHLIPCDDNINGEECLQKTIDFFRPRIRKSQILQTWETASSQDEDDATDNGSQDTGETKNSASEDKDQTNYYAEQIIAQDEPTVDQSPLPPSVPWWFQTFLRDLPNNGAFGWWHNLGTANPPLQFCTIAKVATTEWHEVFCKLNPTVFKNCDANVTSPSEETCETECAFNPKQTLPADTPRSVFIRDPLERLLSAYLNKCYDEDNLDERHCEPNVIFNPNSTEINRREGIEEPLLEDVEDNDKQLFAAYIDIMPLKWNLHVVPQAFACDLYRNLNKFDFVGNMGKDFMFDLERMANQFGGPLPEVLNSSFGYQNFVSKNIKHVNIGSSDDWHGTQAPRKVARFYTAQSVRKALEYMSIDYVLLGLSVPEWAKQMLREDES